MNSPKGSQLKNSFKLQPFGVEFLQTVLLVRGSAFEHQTGVQACWRV